MTETKKMISGLDVLKFIMALFIVDIHVKGSLITPPPILHDYVIRPIESIAVPTFFVISSFLFFRKARYANEQMSLVKHFAKRLTILYLFWCVVWSPIIYIQKDYFHPVSMMTPLYVIREFFFGELFDASWFLGALLVGIPTIALLMRKLNEYVVLTGIAILYLFMCHVLSGNFFSEIQEWYKYSLASGGMKFSFPEGLLWIATGYVMASKKVIVWMNGVKNELAWGATLLFFVLMFFIPVVPKILCVAALLVAAYTWQLPEHPQLYRRFRTYSILFYVIHGCFKKIPKQLLGWENGPVLFVITIIFCFLASEVIMRMKEVKGFGWLRYAY